MLNLRAYQNTCHLSWSATSAKNLMTDSNWARSGVTYKMASEMVEQNTLFVRLRVGSIIRCNLTSFALYVCRRCSFSWRALHLYVDILLREMGSVASCAESISDLMEG